MKEIIITSTWSAEKVAVDMRFKVLDQLFDASDPFPFPEKELTDMAEDAIFDQVVDLNLRKDVELILHIPKGSVPPESEDQVANAVRRHFSFRLDDLAREKKSSWREGRVSVQNVIVTLAISIFVFYLYYLTPEPGFGFQIMVGIFVIINWVTVWHTYEYFVYDYRKLWRKYRVYDMLTRVNVIVKQGE
jgi:hypothetical protein